MSDLDDCSLFEETGEEKSFTMMLEALAVADPDIDDNSCFSFGLLDLDGVETLVSFLQLVCQNFTYKKSNSKDM